MYEVLIAHLRECAKLDTSNNTYTEAADAIEELAGFLQEAERDRDEYRERLDKANDAIEDMSKDLERSKEWETFWEKEANEALKKFQTTVASMPRWIPVEERRAEFPCICCDANGNMPFIPQGIVTIKDDQGVWQIDARLADPNLHQNRLKPVLGYQNRITNWMPLPPVPKEEA